MKEHPTTRLLQTKDISTDAVVSGFVFGVDSGDWLQVCGRVRGRGRPGVPPLPAGRLQAPQARARPSLSRPQVTP